jgi:hypothetical protein
MRRTLSGTVILAVALLASSRGDDGGRPASPFDNRGGDQPPDAAAILAELSDGEFDLDDLGDLADGDFGDIDLAELQDSAEGFAEAFGGEGSGTVEVNGDTIPFTSEICYATGTEFGVEGAGTTGDGTPAWVSISHTVQTRAEAIGLFGEDTVQLLYGDADPVIDSNLQIEYGRSELFGTAADGLPSFDASTIASYGQIEIDLNGSSASGAGKVIDNAFVLGEFGDEFDFSFTAACS